LPRISELDLLIADAFNQRFRFDPDLAGIGADDAVEVDAVRKGFEIPVLECVNFVHLYLGPLGYLFGRQPGPFACLSQLCTYSHSRSSAKFLPIREVLGTAKPQSVRSDMPIL
jgi:hypothetical protein